MALSLQQITTVSGALSRIGVLREDIFRLLDACDQEPDLVLCTVDLAGPPREGDRIRAKLASGEKTLKVEAFAASAVKPSDTEGGLFRYAVVGLPVEASSKDELVIPKVTRARL